MIYQTNRWWIFEYEDEYRELWVKEHNKQTPMWRRQEIFNRTLSDGYHEVNGVKIPCTKLREVTAEEQDELNKIAQEQEEYCLAPSNLGSPGLLCPSRLLAKPLQWSAVSPKAALRPEDATPSAWP